MSSFSNFFGGGSSSSSPSAPELPTPPAEPPSTSNLSANDAKALIMRQVAQEAATNNAKLLIKKINKHCFTRCVPKPGSSLSNGESACYAQCMDKYMAAWNTVSVAYLNQLQRDGGVAELTLG